MMKQILLLAILPLMVSCQNKTENQEKTQPPKTVEVSGKNVDKNQDMLKINYQEHKNLLDILTMLPDSAMRSWKWDKNERIKFVDSIKKNNFTYKLPQYIFSKISLVSPNALGIQVVDGYWILAVYRVKQNHYIAITDDIVGDVNDLHSFEYENGQLNDIPFENLFGKDFFLNLATDKNNAECTELLEDNIVGFEYDFTNTAKIKISNSYYLKENEHKNCLKGNTLIYKFNPKEKKFDLTEINWTKE